MTVEDLGKLLGQGLAEQKSMKAEYCQPGNANNGMRNGSYILQVRTTRFFVYEDQSFILGAATYGTSPIGTGAPITYFDVNFNQGLTKVGRDEIAKFLKGEAATEIGYVDFGFGTGSFSTNDTDISQLKDECVGYWNFDQNPGGAPPQLTDQTATGNDGTSGGSMTAGDEVAGILGNAWDFDGTDDYVDFDADAAYIFPDGMTISMWFKPADDTEQYVMDWNGGTHKIEIKTNGASDSVSITGSLDTVTVTGALFTAAAWNHLMITLDRSSGDLMTVYVNNVSQGTDTSADLGTIDFTSISGGASGNNLVLGDVTYGIYGTNPLGPSDTGFNLARKADGTLLYEGLICELGIWTRPVIEAERDALYYAGVGRTYPFYTRTAVTTTTKTDGQIVFKFLVPGANYDGIEFNEFGLFTTATDGVLYTRHKPTTPFSFDTGKSYSVEVTVKLEDIGPGRGLITTAGLNVIRDFVAGDAATAPTHNAWGTGTTAITAADTTLEGEQERNAFIIAARAANIVTYTSLLTTAEANGTIIYKSGIFNAAAVGTMLFEQKFPAIDKTDTISIQATDTVKVL